MAVFSKMSGRRTAVPLVLGAAALAATSFVVPGAPVQQVSARTPVTAQARPRIEQLMILRSSFEYASFRNLIGWHAQSSKDSKGSDLCFLSGEARCSELATRPHSRCDHGSDSCSSCSQPKKASEELLDWAVSLYLDESSKVQEPAFVEDSESHCKLSLFREKHSLSSR